MIDREILDSLRDTYAWRWVPVAHIEVGDVLVRDGRIVQQVDKFRGGRRFHFDEGPPDEFTITTELRVARANAAARSGQLTIGGEWQ